jgi:4'-phosphopantetheinyl transferase EntD
MISIAGLPNTIVSTFKLLTEAYPDLHSDEIQTMNGPHTPARLREYSFGRSCAKDGIRNLKGTEILSIPSSSTGEPIWPMGISGSISHKREIVGAVIGDIKVHRSLGLDIEIPKKSDETLIDKVCTSKEKEMIQNLDRTLWSKYVCILFSAKESFFKFQYPILSLDLHFTDVEVELDILNEAFQVETVKGVKLSTLLVDDKFAGIYRFEKNFLISISYCVSLK